MVRNAYLVMRRVLRYTLNIFVISRGEIVAILFHEINENKMLLKFSASEFVLKCTLSSTIVYYITSPTLYNMERRSSPEKNVTKFHCPD